jgi:hypothetical protein
MSFFVQAIVGLGYMRNASSVYKGEGDPLDPVWSAQPIGTPGAPFTFKNADDGIGVFSTALAINPAGFSPYGDRVTLRRKILEFSAGFPGAFVPIPNESVPASGVVWGWFTFPLFDPTTVYALVFLPNANGPETAVFALPDELGLEQKNPHFP